MHVLCSQSLFSCYQLRVSGRPSFHFFWSLQWSIHVQRYFYAAQELCTRPRSKMGRRARIYFHDHTRHSCGAYINRTLHHMLFFASHLSQMRRVSYLRRGNVIIFTHRLKPPLRRYSSTCTLISFLLVIMSFYIWDTFVCTRAQMLLTRSMTRPTPALALIQRRRRNLKRRRTPTTHRRRTMYRRRRNNTLRCSLQNRPR